jgi:S-adenosylmethionine-diacylgycerolhomoserine-N-methlytransferase
MNPSDFWNTSSTHRERMTSYYKRHAPIYDVTRWMFLFGRRQIIQDLRLEPGEVVVEVGCGTGKNFDIIRNAIGETGELIAVDCSDAMLTRARERVRLAGWKNVHIIDQEYARNTVTRAEADAVIFSYSLSMIPAWQSALNCAREELKWNGRIGIVDFCISEGRLSRVFAEWMMWNHVEVDRAYRRELDRHFRTRLMSVHPVMADTWSYFRYIGHRSWPR